ncbi:hypothetical protein MRX96_036824 [Rhipicephalus microplus]
MNPLGFPNTGTDWLRTPPWRRSSAIPGECWTVERAVSEFFRAGVGVPNTFALAAADKLLAGSFSVQTVLSGYNVRYELEDLNLVSDEHQASNVDDESEVE